MLKNYYYCITIEENGKFFAYAETVNGCNNLVNYFKRIKNAVNITAENSRTAAEKQALLINENFSLTGQNLF